MGSEIKQVSGNGDCLFPFPGDEDSGSTSQHCDEIGHFGDLTHEILYVMKPVKEKHLL